MRGDEEEAAAREWKRAERGCGRVERKREREFDLGFGLALGLNSG